MGGFVGSELASGIERSLGSSCFSHTFDYDDI